MLNNKLKLIIFFALVQTMVQSRGRGDTSKGRGESYRGRGKGTSTTQSMPHGRYQLRDEPSLSHSTSEGSESASQASEPSATPIIEAQTIEEIPEDGRGRDGIATCVDRSKKKEACENRFLSLDTFTDFCMW